jgi:hypothetical protein
MTEPYQERIAPSSTMAPHHAAQVIKRVRLHQLKMMERAEREIEERDGYQSD